MSRIKKCDDCGGNITKLGVDGEKLKTSTGFGESYKVVGHLKSGEGYIRETPTVIFLCIHCLRFHNLIVEKNKKIFFDTENKQSPELDRIIAKKAAKSSFNTSQQ